MSFYSRSNVTGGTTTSDHIYYNISIINNDDTTERSIKPLVFSENRANPYIINPSEYYMSVVRFLVDTTTLPVFIPTVKSQQQVDARILAYQIGFSYGNDLLQDNLYFYPQLEPNAPYNPPYNPQNGGDFTNPYYWIYSYDWFIYIINLKLSSLWASFISTIPALTGVFPPVMTWDSNTNKATIHCDNTTPGLFDINTTIPGGNVSIYFDTTLYNLFSSFKAIYTGYQYFPNYKLAIQDTCFNKNQGVIPLNSPPTSPYDTKYSGFPYPTISLTQEYSTISIWNPIQSIVFTTSFLTVVPEVESKTFNVGIIPYIYSRLSVSNDANIINSLTDFEFYTSDGVQYKPMIFYNPTAEYKLTDLTGTNPLSNIEIKGFWKDNNGNLNPLLLSNRGSADIKIMFRKKSFNN